LCAQTTINTGVIQKEIKLVTITWFDEVRNRLIPIAIYTNSKPKRIKQKVVILSHRYGQNKGGDYLAYSYLTFFLAKKGYFVISIQHELPTDDLIPLEGKPQIVRRPFWETGADNILFVINELKKSKPYLNFKNITIIGHSNGGDMTALFPQKYPNIVKRIITLDNRRMPLPKMKSLQVLSLRSSDQPADEGVLPSDDDLKKYGITIMKLPNTIHNHMDDNGSDVDKDEIKRLIYSYLK
jgi:pimeloyl-ACP methyl ester carboxylesterase